jgi:hypothetical protein
VFNEPPLLTSLLSTSLLSLPLPPPISCSILTETSPELSDWLRRFSGDSAIDSDELSRPTRPLWSRSRSAEIPYFFNIRDHRNTLLDRGARTRKRVWTRVHLKLGATITRKENLILSFPEQEVM